MNGRYACSLILHLLGNFNTDKGDRKVPDNKFMLIGIGLVLLFSCQSATAKTHITFWTCEVEEKAVEIQQNLASDFQAKNPDVKVKAVPVDKSTLLEKAMAALATRKLPDVVLHPLSYTARLANENIFDVNYTKELVKELGENTFAAGALNLVKYGQGFAAIPVEGWGQVLVYRKDLLKERGLQIPSSWKDIKKAAQALHDPPLLWGFEVPTSPNHHYTQQVLEAFSLSNGARLVDEVTGQVNLNTSQFIATLRFYKELSEFTPAGNVHQGHTKADYLSGRCAMMVWPSFILSDLCEPGGENMSPVEELNKKTGFVAAVKGREGEAQFGHLNCLGVTTGANKKAAARWVKFMLAEGYISWLGIKPEGKLPVRKGTRGEPGKFIQGWKDLSLVGEDKKISKLYDAQDLNAILTGIEKFDRWGFGRGKEFLMSRIYRTKVVPIVLKKYLTGDVFTAEIAASLINELVKGLEK